MSKVLWLENLPNYPKSNSLITNYCFFFLLKNSLQYIFLTFKCDPPYQLFPQNCTNNSELWKRYLHFLWTYVYPISQTPIILINLTLTLGSWFLYFILILKLKKKVVSHSFCFWTSIRLKKYKAFFPII